VTARLALDYEHPSAFDEAELVKVYRDSLANDRTMLVGLLEDWAALSPSQRGALVRVAGLLVSGNSWKRRDGAQP
jgi:hypothetical protein